MALNRPQKIRRIELHLISATAFNYNTELRALVEGKPILNKGYNLTIDWVSTKGVL